MNSSDIVKLTTDALWLVVMLCAPPIVAASAVGLAMAILQAATQIQEQTLQYAIKFMAVVVALFLTSAFLASTLYAFADRIFSGFAAMVAQ